MRITTDYGIHDYFKFHEKTYCEQKTFNAYNVGEKLYKEILREFFKEIGEHIIQNNLEFVLPFRLGSLSIRKFKPSFKTDGEGKLLTRFPIDWKLTNELWETRPELRKVKYIYHFNLHTDEYRYKFKYDKRTANYPCKNIYMFKFARPLKRELAANLKNPKFKGDFFKL